MPWNSSGPERLDRRCSPFLRSTALVLRRLFPGPRPSITIKDFIGDLVFGNPRVTQGAEGGFICDVPPKHAPNNDDGTRPTHYIHNHQTDCLDSVEKNTNRHEWRISLAPI